MEPTYEVLHQSQISGPWRWRKITVGLRNGQFALEDSFRRQGTPKWRSLKRNVRLENLIYGLVCGLVALGFIAAGTCLVDLGLGHVKVSRQSVNWPSVAGKITCSSMNGTSNGFMSYEAEVFYRFKLDGKDHIESLVDKGSKEQIESILGRHPMGSTCTVYYNSKHHWCTILDPGVSPHSYRPLIVGEVFIALGLAAALLALNSARDRGTGPVTSIRKVIFRMVVWGILPILAIKLAFWLP